MKKWGLQLFSIRDFMTNEDDIRDSLARLKSMGYEYVQTAGFAVSYDILRPLVEEAGLKIAGTHYNFDKMVTDIDKAIEEHKILGADSMGIPYRAFDSADDVKRFIETVNELAEKTAKNGIKIGYHNHYHEFYKWENGLSAMEMLCDGLDKKNTFFILDTCWVQYAGEDVRMWIEKLKGRIDILHLKDIKVLQDPVFNGVSHRLTEVGKGNLNWRGILKAAEESGVEYYIVEQDNSWEPNCFMTAKNSLNYLKALDADMMNR